MGHAAWGMEMETGMGIEMEMEMEVVTLFGLRRDGLGDH